MKTPELLNGIFAHVQINATWLISIAAQTHYVVGAALLSPSPGLEQNSLCVSLPKAGSPHNMKRPAGQNKTDHKP